MSSAFYGLHIAKSGLFASQKGLEVVGNNIANETTEGYTRQRVNLVSEPAVYGGGRFADITTSNVGGGVTVQNISQIRDRYLDSQSRSENGILGEWETHANALSYIEDLFNDSEESGIDDVLSSLFGAFEELSKSPENEEIRILARREAISFTDTMNYYASQLEKLQNQQNDTIKTTVDEINTFLTQISDYNIQIIKYERTGGNANELRDKRNTALDELSKKIDIKYSESSDGFVSVTFGKSKISLVDTSGVHQLSASCDLPDYYGSTNKFYSVYTDTGISVTPDMLTTGSLKGYMDTRDGNTNLNAGIPYFLNKLDNLATGFAQAFNELHRDGFTLPNNENGNVSQNGIDFFDIGSDGAKSLSLSSEILDSVFNIAASSVLVDGVNNRGNNENILKLLEIVDKNDIPVISNMEQYLKGIISDVAVSASYANGRVESQNYLINNIEYKKMAVSGVSVDEEMTNMITFQKAYSASARLITAFDEQLDTLINKMGVVGR